MMKTVDVDENSGHWILNVDVDIDVDMDVDVDVDEDFDVDVDEDVDVDREDEAGCMQLSALTLRTHCPAAEGPSSQGASVCHQCASSVLSVCN